jgi:hypothetical protein
MDGQRVLWRDVVGNKTEEKDGVQIKKGQEYHTKKTILI